MPCFSCFHPEQGAHSLGDATLFANNPPLIIIGDLQLERYALFAGLLGDYHIIR